MSNFTNLCNGTRLICKRFDPNVINAEIVVGQHAGVRAFPFKLKRKQFPIRLSFAITTNKAQGYWLEGYPDSVFLHGQLYVALSRGISRRTTKVLVKPVKEGRQTGIYTSNIVYQEVLHYE